MTLRVDVAIVGSGFAGSILAWILAKEGVRVALIDSATHPRFAIGESSTPIADMILRRLGSKYKLDELESLSTWGGWQKKHADLGCGCKRGFSYFVHTPGQPFGEATPGENSLLVAASSSDELADTHWFRADVDEFFYSRAIEAGAIDLTGHKVVAHAVLKDARYSLVCTSDDEIEVTSDWIVDASGQSGVLARLTGAANRRDELVTRTHSVFAHYTNVGSWTEHLQQIGIDSSGDPFDADDAAQHHLLDGGWLWMLRFNNQITSVGYTAPLSRPLDWSGYPSLESLIRHARLVAPQDGPRQSPRIQRFFDPVIDERRIMLPTAAVTMDPLHSTGIAHALAGVDRLAGILTHSNAATRDAMVAQYRRSVLEETRLLDRLVSTAYATMSDFPRFTAACMLYFAGAIRCEERYQRRETPTHLWNADDNDFVEFVDWACRLLVDDRSESFHDSIRERLVPWNTAGLLDASAANRYAYTATK